MRLRRFKPNQAHLRVATLAILIVMCTLLILSAVFPFPEATISSLLSIGLGTGRYASAQPVSTNGMAYAQVNKSGCCVRKGNCQIRLDFYLEPEDVRYYDKYLYLVDTDSPEYLAGYPGKVDEFGNPIDQAEWDKWWDALPRVWVNTPFHTHFVYLPPDFTEEDIKTQIDIHLGNFYQAFQDGWDAVQGGMRHGWATDTRIRPTDYSKTETPAQYDARIAACESAVDSLTEFSYKPDGEIRGETFPSTDIDIGDAATDRASGIVISTYTVVNIGNSANDTGVIDYAENWVGTAHSSPDVWIGTFSKSGSTFTVRDSESAGTASPNQKNTYSGLDIDVETGDYIGTYAKAGYVQIDRDTSGGDDMWYYSGECIDASDSQTFTQLSGAVMSLYGTGETAGGEPSIANTPSSNAFGVLEVGSQATTGFEYFTITNNGTVAVDVTIQGGNMTGGDDDVWVLSDTATQGENQFGMIASTDSETLYESCTSNNDYYFIIGEEIFGQTFTPSANHTITSAQMLMFRDNGSIGDVIISIWATNGTIPTGNALATYTFDGDTLTTSTSGEWVEATFNVTITATAGTMYAVVAQAPESTSYYLNILEDLFGDPYANGTSIYKESDEDPWVVYDADTDACFKEYGGVFDIIVKQTPTYNTLVSNLAAEDTQDWGLLLLMPTSLSGYDMGQMTATITLVASEAS